MNRFIGILNASPQKRYRNFVSTAADREWIWLFKGTTWEVWAEKEFAIHKIPEDNLVEVNVHDFCNEYLPEATVKAIPISVFPNGVDLCVVPARKLKQDLVSELERIE